MIIYSTVGSPRMKYNIAVHITRNTFPGSDLLPVQIPLENKTTHHQKNIDFHLKTCVTVTPKYLYCVHRRKIHFQLYERIMSL